MASSLSYWEKLDKLLLHHSQSWHELHTKCPPNLLETYDPARSQWWAKGHEFSIFSMRPVVGPLLRWCNVVWWKFSFFVGTSYHRGCNTKFDGRPASCKCQFPFSDRSGARTSRTGSCTSPFSYICSGRVPSYFSGPRHRRCWGSWVAISRAILPSYSRVRFVTAQILLPLMILYCTLERYWKLLHKWIQASKDCQPRQNLLTGNHHCAFLHVPKIPMQITALVLTPLWITLRKTILIHLNLSKNHSWRLKLRSPCFMLIKATEEFPQIVLVTMQIATFQLTLRVKFPLTSVLFVLLLHLKAIGRNILV